MTLAHVFSLVGLLVAALAVAVDVTWVVTAGMATFVTQFAVAEARDPGLRGLLAFLSVPTILTVALLPTS